MSGFERTFDNTAAGYDEVRPAYPASLFADLLRYHPLDSQSTVLELGAGTGKATKPVLDTGCRYVGLEPTYGYPKVFELLKHGGCFARFAYHAMPDKSRPALKDAIPSLYDRCMPRSKKAKSFGLEDARRLAEIAVPYGFVRPVYHLYHAPKDFTADDYLKLLHPYLGHMALETSARNPLFQGIHDTILQHGGIITVQYIVDLELAAKP